MGKASKCFKAILGFIKKSDSSSSSSSSSTTKKKWSDVKSYRDNYDYHHHHHYLDDDDDKSHNYDYGVSMLAHHKNYDVGVDPTEGVDVHSNSNDVVVKTSSTIRTTTTVVTTTWNIEERAAVVIQSHFRAYLSRRALRALKGLVKLQALVRGHFVRKQTADMLRRMQALIRAQSRALASRSHVFESPPFIARSTQFHHHVGPTTPDKFEQIIRARSMKNDQMFMLKRNNTSNHMGNVNAKQRNLFHSSELSYDETCYTCVDNSPQLHSTASSICARSRTGPNGARSYTKNHPNYMCYTEAAKAKTRSMSAPKLRPDKRYSKGSNSYVNFTSKGACSGSVRGYSDEFHRDFLSRIY